MIGKNNQYLKIRKEGTKVETYSIKKFKVGTASVVIGASIFFGAGAVAQASEEVSNNTTSDNTTNPNASEGVAAAPVAVSQPVAKETTKEDVASAVAAKLGGETAKEVKALDKTKLENYIAEIEAKLANGTYANKTEESVAALKADLEAAKTALANATTQDELTKAYSKLVTTANTKLKAKPVEKKETPEVDTTNGQPTVGKKAENTEKKSESNSIENTGSHDSRNGKTLDKDNAFRTEATAAAHEATTNKVGNISYTMEFSDDAKKEIYLYNQEDTNIDITVNSTAGNISSVKVRGGGNRPLDEATKDSAVQTDGFGWSYTQTLTETPGPVTMNITGKTNERFLGLTPTNRREDQNSVLGDRYLVVADAAGGSVSATSNGSNQPGYFKLVVKSQTYKYSIQQPELNGDKIGVADINNLTAADIQKIKDQINIEYSKTSTDARLTSKKGTALENKSDVVKNIEVSGGNITVTYNDDSTDTATISSVVRTNEAPTLDIPYSNKEEKQIYLYTTEESDISLKVKDDSGKVKEAVLKFPGGQNESYMDGKNKSAMYLKQEGMTTSEVTASEDSPYEIKLTGTIPKGAWGLNSNTGMTRILYAKDTDDKDTSASFDNNKSVNGYIRFIQKDQTTKYDIKTLDAENKIAVNDANDLTDADLEKIKNNLKIEYAQTNDDARLADKKGQVVEDASKVVDKVEKDGDNLVVTYKDGSKDTKPVTDVVRTNNAPEVKIPYSVDGKKDVYVYANEDFDIPVKFTDDSGKIVSATINRGGNVEQPAKDAANPNILDNEYESTVEKISEETTATEADPAVVHIKGNYSKATPGLAANKFPTDENGEFPIVTRYATATDKDGRNIFNNATGSSYASDPGAFRIVLKAQTAKYDVKELADAEKPVVSDIKNISPAELDKIKENLQLEYSKKNKDKNINKDEAVTPENVKKAVDTVKQDGDNLVVTYKDGSKDTIPVDKVAKLDKQPYR